MTSQCSTAKVSTNSLNPLGLSLPNADNAFRLSAGTEPVSLNGRSLQPVHVAFFRAALIQLQPNTYTIESIASRVGRSPAYVSGRLRLIQLIPEAKQAFYEDKLTVAHAFEVARLQPNDRRRALQECSASSKRGSHPQGQAGRGRHGAGASRMDCA
jgi:hypothetical protein